MTIDEALVVYFMKPVTRLIAPVVVLVVTAAACLTSFADSLVISEFLASNQNSLRDEDGDHEDWIEILNEGNAAVDPVSYTHLTLPTSDLV